MFMSILTLEVITLSDFIIYIYAQVKYYTCPINFTVVLHISNIFFVNVIQLSSSIK